MDGYRLEADAALREIAGRYPDIVAAMRISLKSGLDWTRCLDFLLSAAEELRRCLDRGDSFRIDDVVAQFGDVAAFFDEDITNKIYTERRFIQFIIDFGMALGIIFNVQKKEKVMDKQEGLKIEQKTEMPATAKPAYELVDARELSAKEAEFMAWAADRFDEEAWLKKHGLISPEAEVVEV